MGLEIVNDVLTASAMRRKARLDSLSAIEFSADLPVAGKRADLHARSASSRW